MPGLVAVTGATGFIGRNLVAKLAASRQYVRALTRHPRPDTEFIHWVTGTLEDNAALERLVTGAAAIVHCAGRVRGSSLTDFLKTNLGGTVNLLRATTTKNSQAKFLLISSLAAREPQLSWYADSKRQAEQHLISHAGNMRWAIFRPTAVYGPGDRELVPLFKATRLGLLPMTGTVTAKFGLIYIDDLVTAIQCWLDTERTVQGVYELDDGTPGGYDHETVKKIASKVWKRPVYSLPVPIGIIRSLASLNLGLARVFHYSPMLTPGKVRELQHPDWVCDNSTLTRMLGWQPRNQLKDTLIQSVLTAE